MSFASFKAPHCVAAPAMSGISELKQQVKRGAGKSDLILVTLPVLLLTIDAAVLGFMAAAALQKLLVQTVRDLLCSARQALLRHAVCCVAAVAGKLWNSGAIFYYVLKLVTFRILVPNFKNIISFW